MKADEMKRAREANAARLRGEAAAEKASQESDVPRRPAASASRAGRPVLEVTRGFPAHTYLHGDEFRAAGEAAEKAGVTLSTWIRKLVQAALKEEK